jgi:hypothetical protein
MESETEPNNKMDDPASDRKHLVELISRMKEIIGENFYYFLSGTYDHKSYRDVLYTLKFLYNDFAPKVSLEELTLDMDKLKSLYG